MQSSLAEATTPPFSTRLASRSNVIESANAQDTLHTECAPRGLQSHDAIGARRDGCTIEGTTKRLAEVAHILRSNPRPQNRGCAMAPVAAAPSPPMLAAGSGRSDHERKGPWASVQAQPDPHRPEARCGAAAR
eukprot:1039996-Prymnesium_polylepis.1